MFAPLFSRGGRCGLRGSLWSLVIAFSAVALGAARADIVINEILYRPGTALPENTKGEFVELLNTGAEAVSLDGWQFTKGVAFTFPAGTSILPGGYLVVAANVATFQGAFPSVSNVVGGWTGQLSNSGERIELVDATGKVIDSVEYSEEGDWARRTGSSTIGWTWTTPASTGGYSLELRNPALPHDRGQNWTVSAAVNGTPGAVNSLAASNLAPLIGKVRHSPAVPKPSEAITISCTLEDENPAAMSATLFWRRSTSTPGAFQSVAMTADANNRFTAVIPAQIASTVVEFYVRSTDGTNSRTWPAPIGGGLQNANALFQVSNVTDTGAAPHYRLILTSQELSTYNNILANNRSVDTELNATLVATDPGADGGYTIRYLCGMRLRGNSSRSYNPPPLRVNLPADNPWGDVGAMNLNTKYPWLQVVGLRLLATCGIAAEDAKGVQVSLNNVDRATGNSTLAGLHAHVEPLDSRFVRRHFPSDSGGNLYAKRSANFINGYARDKIRWGVVNESLVRYTSPSWWLNENWDKDTNSAANDWSDLTAFARTMHTATGPTYKEQVGAKINIEQWLRWFAILTLLNDYETNPSNGIDDDYSMYRGEIDPRFVLIPHDLDTILGQGDSGSPATGTLFPFVTDEIGIGGDDRIPQLDAFINEPEIRSRYFAIIKELLNGPFSKSQFDAFLRNHIGGWAPQGTINSMISWMDQRRAYALGVVDGDLSARSSLVPQNGFPRATTSVTALTGNFDVGDTATIRVNGANATLNYSLGVWNIGNVALVPGINRIVVQSFDTAGKLLETRALDIWYDTGTTQPLPATIAANTTLTAAGGPYVVTGNVVVKPGVTLTVEAGANLWFDADAKLTVNGVLRMLGSEFAHVRCCPLPTGTDVADPLSTSLPAGPRKWAGVRLVDTLSDQNVIQWTDFLHAQDAKAVNQGSIGVIRSRAVLDHLTFTGTHLRMLYTESSSVLVQNSVFPNMFAANESALTLGLDNIAEQIKGSGTIPAGGFYIIRGNTFGTNKGHNDVVDVSSGRRPSPIVQILDNVFTGVGDEQLDLDGDVYIAGNFFTRAVKDPESSDTGYSSGISTSDFGTGTTSVVVRNVFYDMDHALNLKIGAAAFFENNTVVKIHADGPGGQGVPNVGSAINLYVAEPGGERGDGCFVRDNIFFDAPRVFGNADLPSGFRSKLELFNNMLTSALAQTAISATRPQAITTLGTGNFAADPQFANATVGDFTLVPGTAGTGAGTFGQDLGAAVREGIFITGEPAATTAATNATLRVGGPGIFAYRYRVNGGAWSADRTIGPESFSRTVPSVREGTIVLTGLAPGSYTVEVLGRDFAGNWQTTSTVSKTWTVVTDLPRIVINEVLADNRSAHAVGGLYPDFIELHNPGTADVDLSGKSISDDPAVPAKFVFPAGTTLPAGGYLVLYADNAAAGPGIHVGFALDNHGEGVYLYDSAANGGALLDSVVFGLQLPDLSVGRIGRDGTWTLAQPTPGNANVAQPLGDPSTLRINEWLAASQVRFDDDFVELYNPTTLPVALGGLRLSDEPYTAPGKFVIRSLSFAPARGFVVFTTASGPATDASVLPFQLSAAFEMLALCTSDGRVLHLVDFDSERNDISRGFSPDGGTSWTAMLVPTPGASNLTSGPVYDRMLALLNGLRISEVMYQPAGNADLEFIELVNIGNTALDLTGVRFVEGVDFVFPAMTLTPGSRVLVVKSIAAMQVAYGSNLYIAGEFTGRLDNSGERITLALPAPYDAAILSFRYSNLWAASTAGGGRSLEFTNLTLPPSAWGDAGNWGASLENGGNPTVLATPVIRSTLNASIILGDAFSYQILADNNPTNFTATGLPAGLAFDPLSGVISGNPTAFGTFPVTISASNTVGADSEILTLIIAASGPITGFTWDTIVSPQVATVPFSATIRAVDAKGRTVRSFEGPVAINGPGANPTTTVGTGPTSWTFPLATQFSDARTQVIYLADEIGNAGKITALSLYVTAPPGVPLNNWTIRMKHTALASYGTGAAWEGSDWTTVYQANETVSATGWVTFTFSTPFSYDGISNLLVDFSFDNLGSANAGLCRFTSTSNSRSLYYQANNTYGDPLLWSGQTLPVPSVASLVPNVQLAFEAPAVIVSPTSTGIFTDGVWKGNLVATPAVNVTRLYANDGSGHVGISNLFRILPLNSPVVDSPLATVAVAGQPFSYRITATNSPASYGATGLPEGLTVNAVSGIISGTPVGAGVFSVGLSATNPSGTGIAQLSIDVQPDRDGDGLPDSWENLYGFSPDQPGEQSADTDGDGMSNLAEFIAGTHPRDHASRFVVSGLQRTGTGGADITLTWQAVAGKRYRVLCTSDLKAGSWVDLTPIPITATGYSATFKHSLALDTNVSFYRVEIVP